MIYKSYFPAVHPKNKGFNCRTLKNELTYLLTFGLLCKLSQTCYPKPQREEFVDLN